MFHENKNIIRTFWGCNYSKKKRLIDILLVHLKLHRAIGWTPRYTRYQKVKRYINCGKNYSINTRLNFKTRFVSEQKENATTSEMSWCNVFQRTGSNFWTTGNFPRIFIHSGFMIFTQEKNRAYIDPRP